MTQHKKNQPRSRSGQSLLPIVLITVALAGLIAVQLVWLNIAWELKNQAFRRNVIAALAMTTQDLEAAEISGDARNILVKVEAGDTLTTFSQHLLEAPPGLRLAHSRSIFGDSLSLDFETVFQSDSTNATHQVALFMGEQRSAFIQKVVGELVFQETRPIEERLSRNLLDSLLVKNLAQVEIDLKPEYGVSILGVDSLIFVSKDQISPQDRQSLQVSDFKAQLFPLDLSTEAHALALHFPGQRGYLVRQIGPLLGASLLFVALIVISFGMVMGRVGQQRRFANRLVDFINNMTHEFKTPISTVALASEAIDRQDILDQPVALHRYNRMIQEENRRMHGQVEKILQIAQLERGDFQLNLTQVDFHQLATGVAETFALQIEKSGGVLNLDLSAEQYHVQGDRLHLTNVLSNLIDNAIKYSTGAPAIKLTTRNSGPNIFVDVSDQGQGIPRSEQHLVFDKYYRCPTGNRHDVKGFGLGLSFVRLLVDAHGGSVGLDSTVGQGTRVTLNLPLDSTVQDQGEHDE